MLGRRRRANPKPGADRITRSIPPLRIMTVSPGRSLWLDRASLRFPPCHILRRFNDRLAKACRNPEQMLAQSPSPKISPHEKNGVTEAAPLKIIPP